MDRTGKDMYQELKFGNSPLEIKLKEYICKQKKQPLRCCVKVESVIMGLTKLLSQYQFNHLLDITLWKNHFAPLILYVLISKYG